MNKSFTIIVDDSQGVINITDSYITKKLNNLKCGILFEGTGFLRGELQIFSQNAKNKYDSGEIGRAHV